jgi:hypothetical protein
MKIRADCVGGQFAEQLATRVEHRKLEAPSRVTIFAISHEVYRPCVGDHAAGKKLARDLIADCKSGRRERHLLLNFDRTDRLNIATAIHILATREFNRTVSVRRAKYPAERLETDQKFPDAQWDPQSPLEARPKQPKDHSRLRI